MVICLSSRVKRRIVLQNSLQVISLGLIGKHFEKFFAIQMICRDFMDQGLEKFSGISHLFH